MAEEINDIDMSNMTESTGLRSKEGASIKQLDEEKNDVSVW